MARMKAAVCVEPGRIAPEPLPVSVLRGTHVHTLRGPVTKQGQRVITGATAP